MKDQNTSWGNVAGWYDELLESSEDSYQNKVILPNLLRIVEPKKGLNILDIACGQGFFSRAFYEKGASVTGCDISKELIALAKKNSPKQIRFDVSPADKISFLDKEQGSFDVATIVLALQNIKDLADALSEASRALKESGRLILVLNHPAFRIPGRTSWEWDSTKGKQFRRVDSYMSDGNTQIDMTPGEKDQNKKISTVSFHRPLQSYFKALNKAGFAVNRLEEWISHKKSQVGPRAEEEDRIRKEIPMFICLEAIKLVKN